MQSLSKALALAVLAALPVGLVVAANPAATKKQSAATTSKKRTSTAKKKNTVTASRPSWRSRQLQPTPERYKEIQQALISKRYLDGEPTGDWNQNSMEALRRFQQEQNLNPTGKIDSLSLIALGLGPKHETPSAVPPQPPN